MRLYCFLTSINKGKAYEGKGFLQYISDPCLLHRWSPAHFWQTCHATPCSAVEKERQRPTSITNSNNDKNINANIVLHPEANVHIHIPTLTDQYTYNHADVLPHTHRESPSFQYADCYAKF